MNYVSRIRMLASVLPVFHEFRAGRRPPDVEHAVFYMSSTDNVELFCTLLGRNPERAVVVAHPALVGSYYRQVVSLAEELSGSFSVFLFDFRGHGRSTGRCPLGFSKVSEDLEAVVGRVRGMGFKKLGVAGFSLGAAAAMLLASRDDCLDALVSIGCPPRMPDIPFFEKHPLIASASARALGMRPDPTPYVGPSPTDVADRLPRFPKLLIFGEIEVVPPEEISEFTELVTGPKTVLTVPGAWHADLMGREGLVKHWFEENM